MRKYELLLLIDPTLSEDDRATLVKELKSELSSHNTKLVSEDDWGIKTLAYKIHASTQGWYLLWTIEGSGKEFFELTKLFNLHKSIWRHMITSIDE